VKLNSRKMSLFTLLLCVIAGMSAIAQGSPYIPGVKAISTTNQVFLADAVTNDNGLTETSLGSGVFQLTTNPYVGQNTGGSFWNSGYSATGPDENAIVQFDLQTLQTVDGFHVWNYNAAETFRGFREVLISYSVDETHWKTVPQHLIFARAPGSETYTGEDYTLPFPIQTRYIRFQALTTHRNFGGRELAGLGKVRFHAGGTASSPPASTLTYPNDSGIINVKLAPYNARGDGMTDDTVALQHAIDDWQGSGHIIYLPNGTYLVSASLSFPAFAYGSGHNNISGQSRSGTVLRLKDNTFTNASAPRAVLDIANTGAAQWFDNNVTNLTISTGQGNVGAIGLKFYGNNISALRNVSILSGDRQGVTGLDMGYATENGPLLVKNVKVYGFNTGILTGSGSTGSLVNSVTLEHITLQDQKVVAFKNTSQCLSIRGLVTIGCVKAFYSDSGVITLIDSTLQGKGAASNLPAISNGETLFARNVCTPGFGSSVLGLYGANSSPPDAAKNITEFVSSVSAAGTPTFAPSLFPSQPQSMNLTIKETPGVPQDNAAVWANVLSYRRSETRTYDGNVIVDGNGAPIKWLEPDDTKAIQRAIDEDVTTLYFPKGPRYGITGTIILRRSLRRIVGMFSEFAITAPITFQLAEGAYPTVVIEGTNEQLGWNSVQNLSSRTLVIKDAGASPNYARDAVGNPIATGDLFVENVVGSNWMIGGQKFWGRQVNIENSGTHLLNNNGTVWMLGYKTERAGTLIDTEAGGKTELIGGLCYTTEPTRINGVDVPMFIVNNASASLTIGEVQSSSGFTVYFKVVQETRGSETRTLSFQGTPGTQTAPRRRSDPNAWNGSVLPLFTAYANPIPRDTVYRYAPDGGSNINRYDGVSGNFVDTFASYSLGTSQGLSGAAFGPDGTLYASAYDANSILRFDGQSGVYLDTFTNNSNNARQLLFNVDGSLYTDSYRIFSPDGAMSVLPADGPVAFDNDILYQASGFWVLQYFPNLSGAEDVAYGTWFGGILAANGYLYLADQGDNPTGWVYRYDATNFRRDLGFAIRGLSNPTGMAIAPNGNLVVATDAGVKEYNPFSGQFVRNLPGASGFFTYR